MIENRTFQNHFRMGIVCLALLGLAGWHAPAAGKETTGIPRFEWDPTWPKPLPNDWVLGQIGGVYVDGRDHIWFTNRYRTLNGNEKLAGKAAPPIIELDQMGNVVQSWGGPGEGYEWPAREHGVTLDQAGNVWITGTASGMDQDGTPHTKDHMILKFSHTGKFLMQIGHAGQSKGSNDIENLGQPADITVDRATNEVWVADGYKNRRVIVFDNSTGAYKRHFGAYGGKPDDSPQEKWDAATATKDQPMPKQFTTVHCAQISNDGVVYVCDREHDRIQMFRKDGTFMKEKIVSPGVTGATASNIAFSPDPQQKFIYLLDYAREKVLILRRDDLQEVGSFGRPGHFGGGMGLAHGIRVDSKGNIYIGEAGDGKRVQRFKFMGMDAPKMGQ